MYREKIEELKQWKESAQRKPLIIRGARQVGKTWLLKEFGKTCYQNLVYVNFERMNELQNLFLPDLNPKRILETLELAMSVSIQSENTLIVFDEIQAAERGLTSLKYFCEEVPEYHIIAADSLLGVAINKNVSFPVGKVNFLNLHPLSFNEFLLAMGNEKLANAMKKHRLDLLPGVTGKLKELLRIYFYVGGMPEVVFEFSQTQNWENVRDIQREIILTYENDFAKHAPLETVPRIRLVWQNISAQLAKENKKFIYSVLREGARAKDFEVAIQWLLDCGLLVKVPRISKPSLPLTAYADFTNFKLYMHDIGILGAMSGLNAQTIVKGDDIFTEFKGALTEQFVLQQLHTVKDMFISYWANDRSTAEVDFVIQANGEITPIEVKAAENLQSKSFKFFYEKYKPKNAVRTSLSDFRQESWMTNVPLYIIGNYFW
ncbi:MAG: ATP-binding protein [Bacteroidales bacterium]|jgi:predicted AAA+ superfamily ATPase|nr:ATP-binding protein [Bacteroidales bacterium]